MLAPEIDNRLERKDDGPNDIREVAEKFFKRATKIKNERS